MSPNLITSDPDSSVLTNWDFSFRVEAWRSVEGNRSFAERNLGMESAERTLVQLTYI